MQELKEVRNKYLQKNNNTVDINVNSSKSKKGRWRLRKQSNDTTQNGQSGGGGGMAPPQVIISRPTPQQDNSLLSSRARGHAHRARLDAEILYKPLRASLARKSNPITMCGTRQGPLPRGRLGPVGRRGCLIWRAEGSRGLKVVLTKRCEIKV